MMLDDYYASWINNFEPEIDAVAEKDMAINRYFPERRSLPIHKKPANFR